MRITTDCSEAEDIKAFHYNGVINIMLLKIIHKGNDDKEDVGKKMEKINENIR